MMKRDTETETMDNMAKCLMLLSKVGQDGSKRRVFTCKTCMKEFPSFQALGGHRASHKKPTHEEGSTPSSPKKPRTTSHECSICGLEFAMGQALGGHMRRHRSHGGMNLVTRSLLPEPVTMKKSSSNCKRVVCLDLNLNLAPPENIDLKLELGTAIC